MHSQACAMEIWGKAKRLKLSVSPSTNSIKIMRKLWGSPGTIMEAGDITKCFWLVRGDIKALEWKN